MVRCFCFRLVWLSVAFFGPVFGILLVFGSYFILIYGWVQLFGLSGQFWLHHFSGPRPGLLISGPTILKLVLRWFVLKAHIFGFLLSGGEGPILLGFFSYLFVMYFLCLGSSASCPSR